MAFTAAEKRKIRSYLGYSGGFRDSNYVLESMMDVVGAQTEEAAYCRELLTAIDTVDDSLSASSGSGSSATYGTVKKVDEIEFYPVTDESGAASTTLSGVDYGEILIERLRALLGVTLAGRYFRARNSFYVPLVVT